jgi:hypothetical protein
MTFFRRLGLFGLLLGILAGCTEGKKPTPLSRAGKTTTRSTSPDAKKATTAPGAFGNDDRPDD